MQHPYEVRESLQAQIQTIRESGITRLSTFHVVVFFDILLRDTQTTTRYSGTQVGALEIKCKNLQESRVEKREVMKPCPRDRNSLHLHLQLWRRRTWAIKLKSAALEFGVKSAEERTKYQNQIQKLNQSRR